jgi:hypothetical protein
LALLTTAFGQVLLYLQRSGLPILATERHIPRVSFARVRGLPTPHSLDQAYQESNPTEDRMLKYTTYRLFLIFAIGSTWLESPGGAGRSITVSLRNRALQNLPSVLEVEDIVSVPS